MIGNHAISLLADGWAKGIRTFDPQEAVEAYRHEATNKGPWGPANGRDGLRGYYELGYVPSPEVREGTAAAGAVHRAQPARMKAPGGTSGRRALHGALPLRHAAGAATRCFFTSLAVSGSTITRLRCWALPPGLHAAAAVVQGVLPWPGRAEWCPGVLAASITPSIPPLPTPPTVRSPVMRR